MRIPLGRRDYDMEAPAQVNPDDYNYGEYTPKHPFREGFTMGIAFSMFVGIVVWLLSRLF